MDDLKTMLDAAIMKLRVARDDLDRGNLGLAHFDLSLCHVALHEADSVLISMLLKMPMPAEIVEAKKGALR